MTGRERILHHLAGRDVDCLPAMPITMQFAADLLGAPYLQYVTNHRVLVEAQIRTATTFDFDYVSAISDPAREAGDLGAAVIMTDDSPPAMDGSCPLVADKSVLSSLRPRASEPGPRMTDRLEAISQLKQRIGNEKLVEGWIEGPCAEAADLRGLENLMTDFTDDPEFIQDLFEFVLEMEVAFARWQIEAGADIIGIGDAAASLVGPRIYREFVLPYEQRMVKAVHEAGALVRLHICGNTRRILKEMGTTAADIIDLDYFSPVGEARQAMGPDQMLLGNIDPVRLLRNGTPDEVWAAIQECHESAGPRYIVGAGCEVPRDTPHENLRSLVGYARQHRPDASPILRS